MSTPLIVLAAILAIFAFVLIPFMMVKSDKKQPQKQGGKPAKRKKKH